MLQGSTFYAIFMCLSSADLDRTERCMNMMDDDAISTNMATVRSDEEVLTLMSPN
jgi:hypothetical protein